MNNNYNDIINLPHYEPKNHKRMSMESRSAQFAPFSALDGYDEEVKETARLTSKRIEIDEELKQDINNKLNIIKNNIKNKPLVTLTYFIYDNKKNGGEYKEITNYVKKIDVNDNIIVLIDNTKIPIKEIIDIKSNIFDNLIKTEYYI